MVSIRTRLILTYALFISAVLLALTLVINLSIGTVFAGLIKNNIGERCREIVASVIEQFDSESGTFDLIAMDALGMYFVHDGYIVAIEDTDGAEVWDARSTDMQRCTAVLNEIIERMESDYRLKGQVETRSYPLAIEGKTIGAVKIETYGPFFYTETEGGFLASVNRVLLIAGVALTVLSIVISVLLADALSRPILTASEAARRIAREHGRGGRREAAVRIRDDYATAELRELSRSINSLAREIEEAEERQSRLAADVAHELRTPLTCVRGYIEAMIDGVWEATPERLQGCYEEVARLSALVDDLEILTDIEWERVSLDKTDFDLAVLLRVTTEQFRAAALEKRIGIRLDLEECMVNADYKRMKQVFVNLISNAVKYTEKGAVTVSARREAAEGGFRARASVRDTGTGISAEALPHIFERFYRADRSRNRETGGAGIGLSIAAAIVRAHGGILQAESGADGSAFTVLLR
jgi:signal transduction histidine kinase